MNTVTLSSKGQLVIPANLRRKLGMASGSLVEVIEESDGIKLRVVRPIPLRSVADLAGMVKAPSKGKPRNLHTFDQKLVKRSKAVDLPVELELIQ